MARFARREALCDTATTRARHGYHQYGGVGPTTIGRKRTRLRCGVARLCTESNIKVILGQEGGPQTLLISVAELSSCHYVPSLELISLR